MTLFHNLGGLEHARGRFAQGEPHARRSVEFRERLRGAAIRTPRRTLAALAALLDGQGREGNGLPGELRTSATGDE